MSVQIVCEVTADHDGWEADVEQMDRDVGFIFRGLERELVRYEFHHPREDRVLRVGYETASPAVLRRAAKAGWRVRD